MRIRSNQLIEVCLALLLIVCAQARAADDAYKNVHTVAVISVLGSDVDMQSAGFMAFHDYTLHTDWNFDSQITDQITKALSDRFIVKPVTYEARAFGDFSKGVLDNYWDSVEKGVLTLPKSNGVDAYIVIFPEYERFPGGMEWQGLVGTRTKRLLYDPITSYGAYYLVGVIDAKTGMRIDWGGAQYPSDRTLTGVQPPVERCANEMWADTTDAWTAQQKMRLRQELTWLIDRSIFYTLASAKLISSNEAAADTVRWGTRGDPSCGNAWL
jgi:hypothetical protein